ncbi:MAG: hypothetical protein KBS84_04390 [Treponema sp.]|nr:hypothetical protein [Candidatus Treponema scatequi]
MTYRNKFKPVEFLKHRFLVIFIILISTSLSFAEDVKDKWTIGAAEFTYSQDLKRGEYEKAVLKVLPELILEQLYGTEYRNVSDQEMIDRKLDVLLKERLSLFLELSKEVKTKNALVLKDISEYQFKKQNDIQDKKIKNIQKKIDDNLDKQTAAIDDFKADRADFASKNHFSEEFVFYQNDSKKLFSLSDNVSEKNFTSYECEKEINDAKIRALITGSVITYGEYAAVTVEMFMYPGARSCGVVTEIGLLSEPDSIAKNIAYRLAPIIENSLPCEIQIKILPEEMAKKTKLTIDSTVYNKIPDKMIIATGVHRMTFDCEGYRKETFSYGFGYEKKYLIEVNLVEEELLDTAVVLNKFVAGNIFYNGKEAENNVMSVKINNTGVLGYMNTLNDNTIFFKIPKTRIADDKTVSLNVKDYDVGEYIEKRRKMLYISYSALVCSLPVLFYSYSNYTNYYKSFALGQYADKEKLRKYQTMSYIGIGLTAGCGIWFVYDLVRYLVSANKALPVEAKNAYVDYNEAVENYKAQYQDAVKVKEETEKAAVEKQSENSEKSSAEKPADINNEEKQTEKENNKKE